jgi:hypothetical protein
MNRPLLTLVIASLFANAAAAAPAAIEHMEPPFWWAGMQHKGLQLMVHGAAIGKLQPRIDYPGVRLVSSTRVANANYLFIDLEIGAGARPGKFDIVFSGDGRTERYSLRAARARSRVRQSAGLHQRRRDLPDHAGPLRQWRPGERQPERHGRGGPQERRRTPWRRHRGRHPAPGLHRRAGLHPAVADAAGRERHAGLLLSRLRGDQPLQDRSTLRQQRGLRAPVERRRKSAASA